MRRVVLITSLLGIVACEALVDFDGLEYRDDDGSAQQGGGEQGGDAGMSAAGTGGSGAAGGTGTSSSSASSGGSIDPDCETKVVPQDLMCPEPPCTSCGIGTCNISCSGICNSTVTCPEGFACNVTCDSASSCVETTVFCPENHPCTLTCVNPNACQGANLICSDSAPCEIICGGQPGACDDAVVQCGAKACTALCADATVTQPGLMCAPSTCLCEPC